MSIIEVFQRDMNAKIKVVESTQRELLGWEREYRRWQRDHIDGFDSTHSHHERRVSIELPEQKFSELLDIYHAVQSSTLTADGLRQLIADSFTEQHAIARSEVVRKAHDQFQMLVALYQNG